MPERGSVSKKGQCSTPETIKRRQLIHPILQYDLICELGKCEIHQEPQESFPLKIFPIQRKYVTYQIRIPTRNQMRKQAQNNLTQI